MLVSAFALVVSFLTFCLSRQIAKWQASVAREQLRQNLYDRRFAIYIAFHELLVAFTERDDVTIELRKANAARAHSPFLLTAPLEAYLKELHDEAFQVNAQGELLRDKNYCGALPKADFAAQESRLASDKLALANRIAELAERFQPLIELKDL